MAAAHESGCGPTGGWMWGEAASPLQPRSASGSVFESNAWMRETEVEMEDNPVVGEGRKGSDLMVALWRIGILLKAKGPIRHIP